MQPLMVALIGGARSQSRLACRLKGRLARRGFRVHLLKSPQEMSSKTSDILIVSCPFWTSERLANWIETEWDQSWLSWYAHRKRSRNHPPVAVR